MELVHFTSITATCHFLCTFGVFALHLAFPLSCDWIYYYNLCEDGSSESLEIIPPDSQHSTPLFSPRLFPCIRISCFPTERD